MGELPRITSHTVIHTPFQSVFLVTVHDPICTDSGDLEAALYGSFLPIPKDDQFPSIDASESSREKLPGAIIVKDERIVINRRALRRCEMRGFEEEDTAGLGPVQKEAEH